MSRDLLTCPFCGGKARVYSDPGASYVMCATMLGCGAEGPIAETQDQAIEAWNTRAKGSNV